MKLHRRLFYPKMLSETEVVDPICLAAKVVDRHEKCCCCGEIEVAAIPDTVCRVFDDVIIDPESGRRVYVTLGLFTIVRLERETQLLIPVIDYCIPQNDCITTTESSPCDLFDKLRFPTDEFFPPEKCAFEGIETTIRDCPCNKD